MSTIRGNTIKAEHAAGRALAHRLTGQAMVHVAADTGKRCCKRSVYGVLEVAVPLETRVLSGREAEREPPIRRKP